MKTFLKLTLSFLTITLSNSSFGQYVSHDTEVDRIKVDTLIDIRNGDKFIIDKQRIYITAIDKNGKLLWKTDPFVDNKLPAYREDRPTIIYFDLNSTRFENGKEIIWICYSSSQFGFLDKKTGEFHFRGQD